MSRPDSPLDPETRSPPSPRTSSDTTKRPSPFGRFSPTETTSTNSAELEKPRSISFAAPTTGTRPSAAPRRQSIQFAPVVARPTKVEIPTAIPPIKEEKTGGRLSSPPPPSTYVSRVSFDTFSNSSVAYPTFTLVSKHAGYTYNRHQRVFLVAVDSQDYSEFALKWLVEEMVEDGDEIICLRVIETDGKSGESLASDFQRNYKQEAQRLLEHIQKTNSRADNKAISVIMELACGQVEQTIQRMISIYSPAFLTVGTRGRSLGGIQGLLPGSTSKWCMQNSPVPVVMVRHPEKRRKKMQKRLKDPSRKGYATILDQRILADSDSFSSEHKAIKASEFEAEAVAKAIGLSSKLGNRRELRKEESETGSIKSDMEEDVEESDSDSPSPTGAVFVESGGMEEMPNYTDESKAEDSAISEAACEVATNDGRL